MLPHQTCTPTINFQTYPKICCITNTDCHLGKTQQALDSPPAPKQRRRGNGKRPQTKPRTTNRRPINTAGTRTSRPHNTTQCGKQRHLQSNPEKHYARNATPPNTKLTETVAHGHSRKPKGGLCHQNHLWSSQKNPRSQGKASSIPQQKKITPRQH